MRKKTVNHLADTIFWYLLYFLPIISYLLFCFCEPVAISSNTDTSTVDSTSYSVNSTYNATVYADTYTLPKGEYTFKDTLDFSMLTNSTENISINFTCNGIDYALIQIYPSDDVMQYGSSMVYHWSFSSDNYKVINVLEDTTFNNSNYILFFDTNTSFVAPAIPVEPTLDIVPFYDYMISAYSFTENNFIYNTITSVFGENGVFNLALDNGIYLYFSWFIGVYLMHLFVDFILFIPRLCHKWLKGFTQGD